MTTDILNISEEQLVDYSKAHNEPSWMTELRKKALKLTETLEMPKPDKTKLRKWDFDSFKQHDVKGDVYQSLSQCRAKGRKHVYRRFVCFLPSSSYGHSHGKHQEGFGEISC